MIGGGGMPRPRWPLLALAAAVFTASLALTALTARSQADPVPGGTVPSVLSLSLSEPTGFRRAGAAGQGTYTSVIRAEVTATDVPTRLSVADGEVTTARRRGHLVRGSSILSPALQAAVDGGSYRSLDMAVPLQLQRWSSPVAGATTKIRLRQTTPNGRALHSYHKVLLVTLMAGGP